MKNCIRKLNDRFLLVRILRFFVVAGFEVRVRLVVGEFDVGVLEGNAGGRGL